MSRIKKLREKMSELKIDAVIIFDELNQRYFSEIAFTDGLLFVTLSEAHLLTDFRYYEVALKSANKEFAVSVTGDRMSYLSDVIAKNQCKVIGFEGNAVSYDLYKSYTERFSNIELVSIGNSIETLRQIKSADEIEKIQKAQDITDAAFSHLLKIINTDMTELDVAVELEYAMRKGGAEGFAFDTIAVSGDATALPHGAPRNQKLKRGFLTIDFGAKVDGYCSDMTRTVVIGRADSDMKKLYNTVLSAQSAAIEFLREGADAGEADKVARDIIESNPEYHDAFGHALGHSVGLFIHESPSLSRRAFGRKLRTGEILTVEPGIYLFEKYGCRIEDMVAIEKTGVYNFTKSPKELIEIM